MWRREKYLLPAENQKSDPAHSLDATDCAIPGLIIVVIIIIIIILVSLQKAAILGTSHIIRKLLQCEA